MLMRLIATGLQAAPAGCHVAQGHRQRRKH
jgi:hypothetical protein